MAQLAPVENLRPDTTRVAYRFVYPKRKDNCAGVWADEIGKELENGILNSFPPPPAEAKGSRNDLKTILVLER